MARNYFENRAGKLLDKIKTDEAFFVTLPEEVHYFTGFRGDSSYLLLTQKGLFFFTDLRFIEQIEREKRVNLEVLEISRERKLDKLLIEVLKSLNIRRLFFCRDDISFALGEKLVQTFRDENIESLDSKMVKELREVKDEYEIEILRENLMLTEIAYNLCLPLIDEQKSEIEIASVLEFFLRRNGSDGMAFETIVLSGERSALPHGLPSVKKICEDEVVLFDFGIKKNCYCSDFTRCFYSGKIISRKFFEMHSVVLNALLTGEQTVREGIKASEVHRAVYKVIEDAGYEKNFWHSTGHGVGLQIHEAPFINDKSETILKEGMVFTIEPGIYIPGVGGIRLEDMVIVRKEGVEVLTSTPYDL